MVIKKGKRKVRKRKIRKERYFSAFAIALLVFVLGILLGIFITNARISYMEKNVYSSKLEFQSLQLQLLYLNSLLNQSQNCDILNSILEESLYEVGKTEKIVEKYIRESEDPRYENYKREYIQTEVNYWLLYQKVEKVCPIDRVAVLYFYSIDDCPDCGPQSTILEYLKKQFEQDLLLFWLDANFIDEPMIPLLKETYNITELPTIIIENKTLSGFTNKKDLTDEICKIIPEHKNCIN